LPGQLRAASALPFSYADVGCTAVEGTPAELRRSDRRSLIGTGRGCFERAAEALLAWRMHEAAGLRVCADGAVETGRTVVLGLRLPAGRSLVIPCRVVDVIETPDRCGFAYGTLPGHPERGEERFTVAIDGSDDEGEPVVTFETLAISTGGDPLVRLAGPVHRAVQRRWLARYEAALRRLATGA
jgi:uncharacterized protein (UPF0548 family)